MTRKSIVKRKMTITCAALALSLSTASAADGPGNGCYARDYSDAHLVEHPNQIVDRMTLLIREDTEAGKVAIMRVALAMQGHVARSGHGGQQMEQFLLCWSDGSRTGCSVECDGGSFEITRDDKKVLTFRTDYLMVGEIEECGGAVDLAEIQGKPVSYKLNRVDDAVCTGN